MACTGTVRQIPIGSLLAFLVVVLGGLLMCGTFFQAVDKIDTFFRIMWYPVDELIYVRVCGIVCAIAVIILALFILIFAFLAAGATKHNIYKGDTCILGGKTTAAFFIFLAYVGNLSWVMISSVLVIPVIAWGMFTKICFEELTVWAAGSSSPRPETFHYTFNLTYYGIYIKPYLWDYQRVDYRETITNVSDFKYFCDEVQVLGPLFATSLGGAISVLLGMIVLFCALTTYYTRLKLTRELTECKSLVDSCRARDLDKHEPLMPLRPHSLHSTMRTPLTSDM